MALRRYVALGLETLTELALPSRCVACGTAGDLICRSCRGLMQRADGERCRHCWLRSERTPCDDCLTRSLPVRELRSAFVYEGVTRAAVLGLKHRGIAGLASELGEISGGLLPACDIDLVAPIPTPLLRARRRGGNHAEQLAQEVASRCDLPVERRALRRRGWWGTRQAQAQSRDARAQLVDGAFIAESDVVGGRGVLLIDDVATTMASLNEAALTLRRAGATAVDAWTVARVD